MLFLIILRHLTINNTKRLEELQISVVAIENYRNALEIGQAPQFEELVTEAEGRVLEGVMMIGGLKSRMHPNRLICM